MSDQATCAAERSIEPVCAPAARRTRAALLLGTALGCSIAVFSLSAPDRAWATNECGPLTPSGGVDQATCTPAGNVFPSGIIYNDTSGNPVNVQLDSGVQVTTASAGVFVMNQALGAYALLGVTDSVVTAGDDGLQVYTSAGGNVTVNMSGGSITAGATGVHIEALAGGDVLAEIDPLNSISVSGAGNVSGLTAYSSSGNSYIHLTGGVVATSSGANAYGIHAYIIAGQSKVSETGDLTVTAGAKGAGVYNESTLTATTDVTGNISVNTVGDAYGVRTTSGQSSYIVQTGNVSVTSTTERVYGVQAVGSINANVKVYGSVNVSGATGAVGVESAAFEDASAHVYGDVGSTSATYAVGVAVKSIGASAYTYVSGNVTATSVTGNAIAVYSGAHTYSGVHVDGNVTAIAAGQAIGVTSTSHGLYNNNVYVGGDVTVASTGGVAFGVVGIGDQNLYATVKSNVTVSGAEAFGIYVGAAYSKVHVYGDVHVTATGNATGVGILGLSGYAEIGGNVVAISSGTGNASGFYGNVAGDISAHIDGDVYAKANAGNATGVLEAYAPGVYDAHLFVGGNVIAISTQGYAMGAKVIEFGNIAVTIDGNVVAHGYTGAIGLEVAAAGNGVTHVGGHVYAYSTHGNTSGVFDAAGNVYVHGNISAFSSDGYTIGFAGASNGNVTARIDGDVNAQTGAATAIGVVGTGVNTDIYVGGDVEARSAQEAVGVAVQDTGVTTLDVQGNVVALGNQIALGVHAVGPDLSVHIGGNVRAYGTGTAEGVDITGAGYTYVGGGIIAIAGAAGGSAAGFGATSTTGDVGLHVGHDIYAMAPDGPAVGVDINTILAYSANVYVGGDIIAKSGAGGLGVGVISNTVDGNFTLHVGGDIYASSADADGAGIALTSGNGDFDVTVGGNVTAKGLDKTYGVAAITQGAADISIGGNVASVSGGAIAYGVIIVAATDNQVAVGGDVTAIGATGAFGVKAVSAGDTTVTVGGNVVAMVTHQGDAIGAYVGGDSSIYIGGNAVAVTVSGNATGVQMKSTGDAYATVHQNVYAKGSNVAAGAYVYSLSGTASVSVGGYVTAVAGANNADGVVVNAKDGMGNVVVGGDITAISTLAEAYGVLATGSTGVYANVGGNVMAQGPLAATGVYAYSKYGTVKVTVGGDVGAFAAGDAAGVTLGAGGYAFVGGNLVAVSSGAGNATGFSGNVSTDVSAHIDGSVYAKADTGNATGVLEIYGKSGVYNADLYVGGNVVAISSQGVAIGAKVAEFGNISVTISGNVTAHGYSDAIGLELGAVGNGVTRVGGDVYAYSTHGHSTGVLDVAGYVYVHGNVTAFSSDGVAAGFYAESVGNVSAHIDGSVFAQTGANQAAGVGVSAVNSNLYVGGDVEARSTQQAFGVIVEDTGSTTLDVQGNVLAVGNLLAVGVYAIGPDVSIHVGGNVTAYSDTGAGGIHFTGAGYAYVGGSIVAVAGSGANGAVGFAGMATGYIGLHVGQDVYAKTDVGATIGVYVSTVANYDANLFVGGSIVAESESGGAAVGAEGHAHGGTFGLQTGGDVYASSADNQAAGVGVISVSGDIDVGIGGNLVAKGQLTALGGVSQTTGNVSFAVGGDVVATSAAGNATGLDTVAGGFNHVAIGGDVTALGYTGATGIVAESPGDVSVSVAGNVRAMASHSGDAIGVDVVGDASLYIGGDAIAISAAGNATGATMTSTGDAYVTVHQNVYAKAADVALGVYNYGYDHTSVTVGGDVTALAGTGNASGVYAHSKYGSVYISVGGDVAAISTQAKAYGVTAAGPLGAYANVTGNVTVEGPGTAVGVSSVGTGYAEATVGGNVYAGSVVGLAEGVFGKSSGDVAVTVDGSVEAYSELNNAYGAIVEPGASGFVTVGGNVTAISKDSIAIGVSDVAGFASDIYVTGTVEAISLYGGNATGIYAQGGHNARAYAGNVVAEAPHGVADGIYATGDASSVVNVSGNVTVSGLTSATGIDAYSEAGFDEVTVGGNVVAVSAGTAIGVKMVSGTDGDATIGGGVLAMSSNAAATGVYARSGIGHGADITVTGNVSAIAATYAVGINAIAGGDADVVAYGAVSAGAVTGEAIGVGAQALGNITVLVGGNVTAVSQDNMAFGVEAVSLGNAYVTIDGGVSVQSVSGPEAIGVGSEVAGNTSVTIDGLILVEGDVAAGVYAVSKGGGEVIVDVGNVTVHQYDGTNLGVGSGLVIYTTGVTNITAGNVYTTGNFTDGLRAGKAGSNNGDTYVTLNQVVTTGDYSPGAYVYGTGNATVNVGVVYTKGYKSDGVYAVSTAGGVSVTSTMVKTLGDYSVGVYAAAAGPVVVTSATSVTFGAFAPAVVAINTGVTATDTVAVYSGNAITHGAHSDGIYAKGYNSTYVKSNLVVTYGFDSTGIFAESHNGPVTVISGAVHTYYESSDGIVAETDHGDVSVSSGTVLTDGDFAGGIFAESTYGDVTVGSTYVYTKGNASTGIDIDSDHGNVTVTSNTVITAGAYADGVSAYSFNQHTTVNSDYVKTSGYHAEGIYAYGWLGATVNSGTVKTYGNYADGIHTISNNGMANVTSTYVLTEGTGSVGIYAYGYNGVNVNSETVRTYGDFATGIVAVAADGVANVTSNFVQTKGDYAVGVSAYGYDGATVNNTGLVRTFGYKSDGIMATAYTGDVNVTSEDVVTYGDYSFGIRALAYNGNTTVTVNDGVFTYGFEAIGVEAFSYGGNATIINYGDIITNGDFSTGAFAGSLGGTAYVYNGGLIRTYGFDSAGAVAESIGANTLAKVTNFGEIQAYYGPGIVAESNGGYAEVRNFGYVFGGYGGVIVDSTLGSYIYNKGVIKGGDGFAIAGYGAGSVYIENKGSIYGYAILDTSNNTVDNKGRWFAYGNSYFGYGNDVFNNHGIVEVAPFSATPTTTTWSGLTVFNNANLVDLRNGHTGDIFNLVGNGGVGTIWNGLAGSTLGVDASLSAVLTSDRMNIGAANGSTALVVNDTTPTLPGTLNFVGTTVVHATSGSASNFTWVGRTKGFINYELEFFSGPVDWNIVALPSNAAFELLKAPEMAQDFWRRTGDAWSAREQEVRDSMWGSTPATRGEGWEMWAQAQIGGERLSRTETFDVQGQSFSPNLGTDSDWRGFQMGGDNWTSKNWLWGFTGGFLEQNTSFHFDHNSFDITGWNVGAYTGFTSGHFFANGLIKGDWFDLKANMHTVPALETFSGDTWGAKGEMGFRWGSSHLYFEPLADLAWTSTHLDNANFTAQDTVFTFGNATSLRGSIGARIGGQWGQILPYVGLYAAQEFDGKNKTAMITGGGCTGCEMDIQDLKPGSYERADFGFTTTSWNGLEGFLKGEAEFGGHTDGFTGRLGVRWRW